MSAQLRSELLKQRTTRTTLLLLAWMVGLDALVVVAHLASFNADALAEHGDELRILGLGTTLGALFAALLGAISMTGEFRSGTIRSTLLVTPRRCRVVAAKIVAGLLAGMVVGLLAETLTAVIEAAGLGVRGIDARLTAGDYAQLLGGGALAGGLFAVIGVGVGAVVHNQVAALIGLCVWLLLLEPLLLSDVPAGARYAPEAAAGAIAGAIQSQIGDGLLPPALGAFLLLLYAGVAGLAGVLAITRRDID